MIAKKLFLALLFVQVSFSWAGSFTPDCPRRLEVEQAVKTVPDGWTASSLGAGNAASRLENIQFSDGDPVNQYLLAPDSEKRGRGTIAVTWTFTPSSKKSFWVYCEYSRTNVVLAKPLPEGITTCTLTYDSRASGGAPIEATCR